MKFFNPCSDINTSMIEGALMKVGKLSGIYHLENIFNWMNLAQLHVVRNFHGNSKDQNPMKATRAALGRKNHLGSFIILR